MASSSTSDYTYTSIAPATATSGSLMGQTPNWYSSTYGGVPAEADPSASAASAIQGNLSNFGSLSGLAGEWNAFNTEQAIQQRETEMPGYIANMNQWSSDISDLLAGRVSGGTVNQLAQTAAQRGVGGGFGADSPSSSAALLAALGLTSEGQQQQGASQFTSQIGAQPNVGLFDITPYLTTAAQQQSAQNAANVYASSPSPALAAQAAQTASQQGIGAGQSAVGNWQGGGGATGTGAGVSGSGSGGGDSVNWNAATGATGATDPNQAFNNWFQQYGGGGGNTGISGSDNQAGGGVNQYNPNTPASYDPNEEDFSLFYGE